MPEDLIDDPGQRAPSSIGSGSDAAVQLALAMGIDAIGTFSIDAAGQTISWRHRRWRHVGMDVGTMPLARLEMFIGDQAMAALMADLRAAADRRAGEMRRSITVSVVPGRRRSIDVAGRYIYGDKGDLLRLVGVVHRDPLADVRYRAAPGERELELQSILDAVPEPIVVVDAAGTIRAFSKTADDLLGHPTTDGFGRSIARALTDDLQGLFSAAATMDHPQVMEVAHTDGRILTVELRLRRIDRGGTPLFVLFLRNLPARGGANAQGAGEERTQTPREDVTAAARAAAVSEFAAHLTHELNQPLTAITNFIGTAQELLRRDASPARIGDMLAFAASQTLRASDTLHRMTQFTVRRDIDIRPASVAAAIEAAVTLAIAGTKRDIDLVLDLDEAAPTMFVDVTQINQVLANLLRNATESIAAAPEPKRRTITVRSRRTGDWLEIAVGDTGAGIAAAIMPFLFEPLRSTKGGAGSGLGLAISRAIVQAHGGMISARNEDDGGACITFTVPAVAPTIEEIR